MVVREAAHIRCCRRIRVAVNVIVVVEVAVVMVVVMEAVLVVSADSCNGRGASLTSCWGTHAALLYYPRAASPA